MIDILVPTVLGETSVQLKKLSGMLKDKTKDYYLWIVSNPAGNVVENRNACLERMSCDTAIMLDDDVYGFYDGWESELIQHLDSAAAVSPVTVLPSGKIMSAFIPIMRVNATTVELKSDQFPPTCFAFRKTSRRFEAKEKRGCITEASSFFSGLVEDTKLPLVVVKSIMIKHVNQAKWWRPPV